MQKGWKTRDRRDLNGNARIESPLRHQNIISSYLAAPLRRTPTRGRSSPRRLAAETHPGAAVTAASTTAASDPRRMARHQSRNVVKSSRRRCPTCLPPSIRGLSSLAFSSAETMFSGSLGSGLVVCVGLFGSTSPCITRARASPSIKSPAGSGRLDTRSRIRFIVATGSVTTIGDYAPFFLRPDRVVPRSRDAARAPARTRPWPKTMPPRSSACAASRAGRG